MIYENEKIKKNKLRELLLSQRFLTVITIVFLFVIVLLGSGIFDLFGLDDELKQYLTGVNESELITSPVSTDYAAVREKFMQSEVYSVIKQDNTLDLDKLHEAGNGIQSNLNLSDAELGLMINSYFKSNSFVHEVKPVVLQLKIENSSDDALISIIFKIPSEKLGINTFFSGLPDGFYFTLSFKLSVSGSVCSVADLLLVTNSFKNEYQEEGQEFFLACFYEDYDDLTVLSPFILSVFIGNVTGDLNNNHVSASDIIFENNQIIFIA